jgi:hypothetical protein
VSAINPALCIHALLKPQQPPPQEEDDVELVLQSLEARFEPHQRWIAGGTSQAQAATDASSLALLSQVRSYKSTLRSTKFDAFSRGLE